MEDKMKVKILSLIVILSMVLCVQAFAGGKKESPPTEKEKIKQLRSHIAYSENKLKQTYDWTDKLALYNDVIFSIENFIESSNDPSLIKDMKKTLSDWQARASEFHKVMEELYDTLEPAMKERAIEIARARYPNRELEKVTTIDLEDIKVGEFLYEYYTYRISMRGTILGLTTATVDVIVTGQINMRNNTMQVLKAEIR
jgi:hypothetical protein